MDEIYHKIYLKLLILSAFFILCSLFLTIAIICTVKTLISISDNNWIYIYVGILFIQIMSFVILFIISDFLDVDVSVFIYLVFWVLIFGFMLVMFCQIYGLYNPYTMILLLIIQTWLFNLLRTSPLITIGRKLNSKIIIISSLLYPPLVTSLLGSILFLIEALLKTRG